MHTSPDLKSVKVGKQIWSAQNLDVDTFRNGDPIPLFRLIEPEDESQMDEYRELAMAWARAGGKKQAASCDNPYPDYRSLFGRLYNWYAVTDPRGLAPEGWHIPTKQEWATLIKHIGGGQAGGRLARIDYWEAGDDAMRTDDFGFGAIPAGYQCGGGFSDLAISARFWSATGSDAARQDQLAWRADLRWVTDGMRVVVEKDSKDSAFSVRLVKD